MNGKKPPATVFASTKYSPYLGLDSAGKTYIFLSRTRNKFSKSHSDSQECSSTVYVENCLVACRKYTNRRSGH